MKTASYQQFMSLGVLLLLDVPESVQLGFDNLTIRAGSMFKGIKMVPLGVHYLHFSLPEEKHMFKISQFVLLTETDKIRVLRWDKVAQDFTRVKRQDEVCYIEGVKSMHFDCYLVGYDNDRLQIWQQTCCWMNQKVLAKLDPIHSIQTIQQEYGLKKTNDKEAGVIIDQEQEQQEQVEKEQQQEESNKDGACRFQVIRGTIYYSEIPKKLDSSHQNTTTTNLDKTPMLRRVLVHQYKNNPTGVLGEIQYSFITFLLGQNLQSFEQWKKLLNLFCYSQSALQDYLDLYLNFVVVVFNQIKQLPKDFFIDQLSKDSFLVGCLVRLQQYSDDLVVAKKLRDRLKKLLDMIKSNFMFQVPLEYDQDMPTVVDSHDYL